MLRLDDTTRSIAAAIALIAAVGIGLSLTLPLLSVEMERMGVSATASGLASAVAGLAAILVSPFVPALAARIGVGRLLTLALVGSVATLIGFKLSMNYWVWLPLRFLFAACLGTLFILSEYWISATAPEARRGVIMGIYATVLALGFAAGPTVLALVGTSGWPPYIAGIVLFVLPALPLLLARGAWPDVPNRARKPVFGYLAAAPLAATAGFVSGAVETGAMGMLPVMGLRLGFEAATAALLVSAVALGNVVTQIPIGWLSDRFDRRLMLIAIASVVVVSSLAIAAVAAPGAHALIYVLVLWGGFTGAFYTVGLAHLSSKIRAGDLVGANAAFIIMFNVGVLAGPPVAGAAIDASTRYGFGIAMALFGCLVAAAALFERRREARAAV